MMTAENKIKAKPFFVYYLPVFVLALTGFADSIYLSISHYRIYTDISYKSFCAISKAFNCDTVSQSSYAIFLGLPVPLLGVLAYLFFLIILSFSYKDVNGTKRGWHLLFIISGTFTAYSIILAVISNYYIHSYCIMCILSYVVNFFLLFLTWIIIRRFCREPFFKAAAADIFFIVTQKWLQKIILAFIIAVLMLFIYFPDYWVQKPLILAKDIPSGLTEEGHPWIGAENPVLTIVEYSDYRCFQCGKMHYYLRDLILSHPKKLRLVHRHFPMDNEVNPLVKEPFHVGAGKMALLTIYASYKGKFWEMNDLMYSIKENFNLRTIEKETGISLGELSWALDAKEVKQLLMKDIADGLRLDVSGTPSFQINGKMYFAVIPPEILNRVLK